MQVFAIAITLLEYVLAKSDVYLSKPFCASSTFFSRSWTLPFVPINSCDNCPFRTSSSCDLALMALAIKSD